MGKDLISMEYKLTSYSNEQIGLMQYRPDIKYINLAIFSVNYHIIWSSLNLQTETEAFSLDWTSNGENHRVTFLGIPIWDTVSVDDRYHDESSDLYEPLDSYFCRKIQEIIQRLNQIKFKTKQ